MADIFIFYSSKDRAEAEQLIELFASAGVSVWIDRQGIVGAEKWATEIVEGIKGCSTFILLLSPNSVESENVLRELSLASEKRKRVLPVDLEPIVLPSSFEYPLAGLQRVAITEFDKILHAHKHGVEKIIKKDERKSLMILPFEDLSPAQDNEWLASGIVSELISALSNVKALRLADSQMTKEFRRYHGLLTTYATEMNIRYFVQGDVRKFGDQIKISARLLDIETGDYLWQESLKGTMQNIFDFQEEVALKVLDGLKVHLAADEKKKLAERGTENAEAYELYMKASEYSFRQTKEGFELAVQLTTDAIKLDPGYARAYQSKATALEALYSRYDRSPAHIEDAAILCNEALRLKPDIFSVYGPLSMIHMHRGHLDEAEAAAREYIRNEPQNSKSHFALGYFYNGTGQHTTAIGPYEEAVRLAPENLSGMWNLVVSCDGVGEREKCRHWAEVMLPLVERYLKLHPDDNHRRVHQAALLLMSGRKEDAHAAAIKLANVNGEVYLRDGVSLYNTACLFGRLGDRSEALRTFRNAIDVGFKHVRVLKEFLTDEQYGIATLAGTPEYEEVKGLVEKLAAETQKNG